MGTGTLGGVNPERPLRYRTQIKANRHSWYPDCTKRRSGR